MGAYVDSALLTHQLRVRFDSARNFNRPDRAQYLYGTWTAFGGSIGPAPPNAPDPDLDAQMISIYYERPLSCMVSAFVEVPFLFNDPSRSPNESGLYDIEAGIKVLLWDTCCEVLTFQFKNYIPTGDDAKWLTRGHYSIEPGLLYWRQLGCHTRLEAELRYWIPMEDSINPANGDHYSSEVVRYGVCLSHDWYQDCCMTVTPVLEVVGWTVLDGQVFDFTAGGVGIGPVPADGDTIVNVKFGVRTTFNCCSDLYVGYGRAVTGRRWYEDIIRVEYRRNF